MFSFPLLGRTLSWAAPSPGPHPLLGRTLSWAALTSLISLALCASPAAQAQSTQTDTYTVTYSGGATTAIGSTDFPTGPYTLASAPDQHVPSGNAYGGSASNHQIFSGNSVTVNCKGAVTATFTWNGGPNNDPAPVAGSVIVVEQVNASCNGQSGSVSSDLPGGTSSGSSAGSQTYTATRYSVKGGGSFTATCTPTASASSTAPPGGYSGVSVGVGYTATPYPVAINLAGTTKDNNGNLNILVGQHCSASLLGLLIPSGSTVSYQWSVSGTTFQYWSSDTPANGNNPYNPDASYEVDGPGPLTNPTAGWYWNDFQAPTPETVSCTATVTPPAGQGSPFTITVTQTVTVYRPNWTATGNGGNMQVNTAHPSGNGTDYWLYAGPTPGFISDGGMEWSATISPPPGTTFGAGSVEMVQIVIPNVSYTTQGLFGITSTHPWSMNGQEGLDTNYPYLWVIGPPNYFAGDAPGISLTGNNAVGANVSDQFMDYLVYFAPGSTQCVTVAYFVWSTNGNATIPATGSWANYGSAGTVTPSGTRTFSPSNSFPMWTQIITSKSGTF